MPSTGMAEWMKVPAEQRAKEEATMREQWNTWTAANGASIIETAGAGKTSRVTSSGTTEVANDVMLYSLVEAETKEAVTAMFAGHPHLGIPGAWIDVMPANKLGM